MVLLETGSRPGSVLPDKIAFYYAARKGKGKLNNNSTFLCVVGTVGGSRHVTQTDDVQPLSLTVRCLPGSLGRIGYFSFLSLLRTSRS